MSMWVPSSHRATWYQRCTTLRSARQFGISCTTVSTPQCADRSATCPCCETCARLEAHTRSRGDLQLSTQLMLGNEALHGYTFSAAAHIALGGTEQRDYPLGFRNRSSVTARIVWQCACRRLSMAA